MLEKAVTVDIKEHPVRKVGTRSRGSVGPRFPAGLPFPVPEPRIYSISRFGKFPAIFQGLLGNPRTHPQTATAFSSFLSNDYISVALPPVFQLLHPYSNFFGLIRIRHSITVTLQYLFGINWNYVIPNPT